VRDDNVELTVWVTKYAITKGIEELRVEQSSQSPSMVTVKGPSGLGFLSFHGEGNEWHRTQEAAVVRANQMVAAKIVSLDKQRAKLLKLIF
jgi:hypothetical protein